jgi:hypothetical protein
MEKTMKKIISTSLTILLTLLLAQPLAASEILWRLGGFQQPESTLFDKARGHIIVSNINGHPGKKDGNGYLSLVSPTGKLIKRQWVTGLDAPKGMALLGDRLLVADLTRLHIIDAKTGKLLKSIDVKGAIFLNDITANANTAWISDFMGQAIYSYKNGDVQEFLRDDHLNHPNGLLFEKGKLLVASWGKGMRADFTTEQPGGLLQIEPSNGTITPIKGAEKLGNLDGLVFHDNELLVNDWMTGSLYKLTTENGVKKISNHAPGLADISKMANGLLLPFMHEGTIELIRLK